MDAHAARIERRAWPGGAALLHGRVRPPLALEDHSAAVGLRGETEAVLGRPRGAAHAAAARGARTADGGDAGKRRVAELTTVRGYPISPATPSTSPSTQSRNGAVSSRMARIA